MTGLIPEYLDDQYLTMRCAAIWPQSLVNAETVHLGTRSNFSGFATNQAQWSVSRRQSASLTLC